MLTHGGLALTAHTVLMIETAKQYFGEEPDFQRTYAIMQDLWNEANKEYKSSSLAYVKEECKKLVDQIEKEGH